MWHTSTAGAVREGLMLAGIEGVDADQVVRAAREQRVSLPIESAHVSAPSFAGMHGQIGFRLIRERMHELRSFVERMAARKAA